MKRLFVILRQKSSMRKLVVTSLITFVVLLGGVGNSESADFQKGLTAYESSDYATTLREWEPLAKQGNPLPNRDILGPSIMWVGCT
jgi:hypothetical protein